MKRREWWVVEREDRTGPFFSCIKEVAASKIEDGDDDFYLLREVLPGEITLTREELGVAFQIALAKYAASQTFEPVGNFLERELFGDEGGQG